MASRSFVAHALGRVAYSKAHVLQQRLLDARIRGEIGDTLLLLEHDPVITLGRSGRDLNVVSPREQLAASGIHVYETARGGDATYHGPGQLVAYPIFNLKPERCDVRRYVRDLASVMVALARRQGIAASFIEGDPSLVGVWADEHNPTQWRGDPRINGGAHQPAKIGAIGVRISRWVTMHGFAYNLTTDLSAFRLIVPCGISRYGVTSVAALGGRAPTVHGATDDAVACFEEVFEAAGTLASPEQTRSLGVTDPATGRAYEDVGTFGPAG